MAKEIVYEFNWCDYFTPCPHYDDIMVGDYDCFTCRCHQEHRIDKPEMTSTSTDCYENNIGLRKGVVKCSHQ